jgi:hypothetical protein
MAGTRKTPCNTCLVWRAGLAIAVLVLIAVWAVPRL